MTYEPTEEEVLAAAEAIILADKEHLCVIEEGVIEDPETLARAALRAGYAVRENFRPHILED